MVNYFESPGGISPLVRNGPNSLNAPQDPLGFYALVFCAYALDFINLVFGSYIIKFLPRQEQV